LYACNRGRSDHMIDSIIKNVLHVWFLNYTFFKIN